MNFINVPPHKALGAILAHSRLLGETRLRKGQVLSAQDCALLEAHAISEIFIARPEVGDISEDKAAHDIAICLANQSIALKVGIAATGRCNLFTMCDGVLKINSDTIADINCIHPAITFACLADYTRVYAGQMIGTLKVIPFFVSADLVTAIVQKITPTTFQVKPFNHKKIALIITTLAETSKKIIAKSKEVANKRCNDLNATMSETIIITHDAATLAKAIEKCAEDIILIMGAAALVDFEDIIPTAVRLNNGKIIRTGMPVDPGNLLCLGQSARGQPIIGLPGCARSPKLNGFDWVMQRICADIPVTARDIALMGVGGLLDETPSRPSPRLKADYQNKQTFLNTGAIVLAAGRSSRMGGPNKLLSTLNDRPLLSHTLENISHIARENIIVVTGRDASEIGKIAHEFSIQTQHNQGYQEGISTSLKCGLQVVPSDWDAVFIVLGDMPRVPPNVFEKLNSTLESHPEIDAVYPMYEGQQGNPVLWRRRAWPLLASQFGDAGGKAILHNLGARALSVAVESHGVLFDIDTPEALRQLE
jgi:molybdenum cofactor cytidylyltransferase